jgi:hypothetical protein
MKMQETMVFAWPRFYEFLPTFGMLMKMHDHVGNANVCIIAMFG